MDRTNRLDILGGVKQVSELVGTTDITKRNKEKNKRIK